MSELVFDTTKYPISIYAICLSSSILIGLTVAVLLLLKERVNKTVAVFSAVINAILLVYFGIFFTLVANIKSGKAVFGFTSTGGAIGVVIGTFIFYKIFKEKLVFKAYASVIPLMYAVSKLGCFFSGCCGGREYHGPLSVKYIGTADFINDYATFPVPLLECVVFFIIYSVMMIHYKKMGVVGYVCLNMALCAFAKLLIDFLRSSHIGQVISINQICCILFIVVAGVIASIFKKQIH